ncbi:MAG TPA: hypothetical protein VEO53_17555, partial [Candidatus Binatia bacterium]|nr:hypothetical protein [Candidatus Binatia bacterium]
VVPGNMADYNPIPYLGNPLVSEAEARGGGGRGNAAAQVEANNRANEASRDENGVMHPGRITTFGQDPDRGIRDAKDPSGFNLDRPQAWMGEIKGGVPKDTGLALPNPATLGQIFTIVDPKTGEVKGTWMQTDVGPRAHGAGLDLGQRGERSPAAVLGIGPNQSAPPFGVRAATSEERQAYLANAQPAEVAIAERGMRGAGEARVAPAETGPTVNPVTGRAESQELRDSRDFLIESAERTGGATVTRQGADNAINSLHPEMAMATAAFIQAANERGFELGIASGYRGSEALRETGQKAGFAGSSQHGTGTAVDLSGMPHDRQGMLDVREIAKEFGLSFPYSLTNKAEFNHMQLTEEKRAFSPTPHGDLSGKALTERWAGAAPINPALMASPTAPTAQAHLDPSTLQGPTVGPDWQYQPPAMDVAVTPPPPEAMQAPGTSGNIAAPEGERNFPAMQQTQALEPPDERGFQPPPDTFGERWGGMPSQPNDLDARIVQAEEAARGTDYGAAIDALRDTFGERFGEFPPNLEPGLSPAEPGPGYPVAAVERSGGLPFVPGLPVSPTGGEGLQPGQEAPGERGQPFEGLTPPDETGFQPPFSGAPVPYTDVQQLYDVARDIHIPPSAGVPPPSEVERAPLEDIQPPAEATPEEQLPTEPPPEAETAIEGAKLAIPDFLVGPKPIGPAPKSESAVQIFDRYGREYQRTQSAADRAESQKYAPGISNQMKSDLLAGRISAAEFMAQTANKIGAGMGIVTITPEMIMSRAADKVASLEKSVRDMRAELAQGAAAQKEYGTQKAGFESARGEYEKGLWQSYQGAEHPVPPADIPIAGEPAPLSPPGSFPIAPPEDVG